MWTIDLLAGRNAETTARLGRLDACDCMSCHVTPPIGSSAAARNRMKPMFAGLSGETNPSNADWYYMDRLKKMTKMKLLLKGIDTAEDAKLAIEHGADGLIVSNHVGRATETGRGTIDILPEIVDAAGVRIPVLACLKIKGTRFGGKNALVNEEIPISGIKPSRDRSRKLKFSAFHRAHVY